MASCREQPLIEISGHLSSNAWKFLEPGRPPDSSWITISGFVASGARSIAITSSLDEYVADVADDGFILAVLRSPWREKPSVVVVMGDDRRIPCAHPSLA
ncbi:hypothetical protein [Rhodococcus opacus]|uniref:hypothetical protein n=1 Tax=Rhodococcus opacus TaxID=37919 RepID=UPI0011D0A1F5|nr:hypothetical protein [Rhodococcus opacus]